MSRKNHAVLSQVSHSSVAITCQLECFTCQLQKRPHLDYRTVRGQIDDRTHTLLHACLRAVNAASLRARTTKDSKSVGQVVNASERRCCRTGERSLLVSVVAQGRVQRASKRRDRRLWEKAGRKVSVLCVAEVPQNVEAAQNVLLDDHSVGREGDGQG